MAQAIPLLALLGAAGAVALADQARWALRNARLAVARTAFALLLFGAGAAMGSELLARYRDYFADYPGKVARQFQYGLEQALGYARAHEAEYSEIWVTDTNEPYIYVLFYAGWPPSDVHRSLEVRREPQRFRQAGRARATDIVRGDDLNRRRHSGKFFRPLRHRSDPYSQQVFQAEFRQRPFLDSA